QVARAAVVAGLEVRGGEGSLQVRRAGADDADAGEVDHGITGAIDAHLTDGGEQTKIRIDCMSAVALDMRTSIPFVAAASLVGKRDAGNVREAGPGSVNDGEGRIDRIGKRYGAATAGNGGAASTTTTEEGHRKFPATSLPMIVGPAFLPS